MTASAATTIYEESSSAVLTAARSILREEATVIESLIRDLDHSFERAVDYIASTAGHVVVTGLGKAGLVGRKISATLASTGTPSYFLHPVEALHGDLGRVRSGDLFLALSHSGETSEVVEVVRHACRLRIPVLAMTRSDHSRLALLATVILSIGDHPEAGPLRLAPTTSTIAMLALGDALALVVGHQRGFTAEQFARNHPGGSLGLQLAPVEELMRPREHCRIASVTSRTRDVLTQTRQAGRRSGAIMLTDASGRLQGIFTDSDLARLFEQCQESQMLDRPICHIMTLHPRYVMLGTRFGDALAVLRQHKISELPVVDSAMRPVGMIDITDVVGWFPTASNGCGDTASPSAEILDPTTHGAWTVPFPRRSPGMP